MQLKVCGIVLKRYQTDTVLLLDQYESVVIS